MNKINPLRHQIQVFWVLKVFSKEILWIYCNFFILEHYDSSPITDLNEDFKSHTMELTETMMTSTINGDHSGNIKYPASESGKYSFRNHEYLIKSNIRKSLVILFIYFNVR